MGNHRVDETYANHTMKTGGHHEFTVNGKYDVKAGEHIKSVTKVHEIHGSDRVVFKSKGGTIILDASGITLKGATYFKGNVSVTGGSPEGLNSFDARANDGLGICVPCLLKKMANNG